MVAKRLLVSCAVLLSAACYRVTVNTGAPPAPTTIDKQWQMSFIYGLVPPPAIDAKVACPNGVATVVTERSFLNGLVGGITYNIVTPMHAKVTCAAGPVAR